MLSEPTPTDIQVEIEAWAATHCPHLQSRVTVHKVSTTFTHWVTGATGMFIQLAMQLSMGRDSADDLMGLEELQEYLTEYYTEKGYSSVYVQGVPELP